VQRPPTLVPPLRDRNEASLAAALSLAFELGYNEGRILAKLMASDFGTLKDLHAAANRNNEKLALDTLRVLISRLRKKLAAHEIEITVLFRLGYGLRKQAREKICQRLAEYDALIADPRRRGRRIARVDQLAVG